jgi:TatD family-associated radical SAM protein
MRVGDPGSSDMVPVSKHNGQFAVSLDGICYLQITDRSNLHYAYLPDVFVRLTELRGGVDLEQEPSIDDILAVATKPACSKEIVFAGPGEPTLRLYDCLEAARRIRERGGRVRLETDGLANVLYDRDITPDLEGSVDHLVVGLHTHDQSSYEWYFHPPVADAHRAVVEFARRARAFVPRVSLIAMDGVDGVDIEECRRIADGIGARFEPVSYVAAGAH